MTDAVQIEVWSDFACPYCFLTSIGLERLSAEHAIGLHWRSFLLRPSGRPEISADRREIIHNEHQHCGRLLKKQYELELRPGPIGIDTRLAHIAEKYAAVHQKSDTFHLALMKAYWLEGRPINQRSELAKIAVEAGLDEKDFLRGLGDFTFSTAVTIDIRLASKYGIQAVPTLVLAGGVTVKGNQSMKALRGLLEKLNT